MELGDLIETQCVRLPGEEPENIRIESLRLHCFVRLRLVMHGHLFREFANLIRQARNRRVDDFYGKGSKLRKIHEVHIMCLYRCV